MKSQRCAPKLRLSRLLDIFLIVLITKVFLLGFIILDFPTDFFPASEQPVQEKVVPQTITTANGTRMQVVPSQTAQHQVSTAKPTVAPTATPVQVAAPKPVSRGTLGVAYAAPAQVQAAEPQDRAALTSETLNRRSDELAQRERNLLVMEQQIETKMAELQLLEIRIKNMLKEAESTKDQKFKQLVEVYTNMKPKQAAEVLQVLDERVAVKILASMRGRQAGEILTFVQAQRAARLSEALSKMQMPLD